MPYIHPAALEHRLKRWMRPDAHRFIRPDWRRFVRPGSELESFYESFERKYSPDQPRDDHGRWTDEIGNQSSSENPSDRMRVAGTVIRICIAGSRGFMTDAQGNKSYVVTYECAGGRSFTDRGRGHSFPGIRLDPF